MLTAEQFRSHHEVLIEAMQSTLTKCVALLYDPEAGNKPAYSSFLFEDEGRESFQSMAYNDATIVGIADEGFGPSVWLQNMDGTISYWGFDCEDLTANDYIGLIDRVQTILDRLGVDYKNHQ